jgi:hypothetical protein
VHFELLPSSRRFRSTRCRTQRYSRTYIPTVVSLLNAESTRKCRS